VLTSQGGRSFLPLRGVGCANSIRAFNERTVDRARDSTGGGSCSFESGGRACSPRFSTSPCGLYLALRRLIELVLLRPRSPEFKELEIVVLRHELAILRRQVARPAVQPADRGVPRSRESPPAPSREPRELDQPVTRAGSRWTWTKPPGSILTTSPDLLRCSGSALTTTRFAYSGALALFSTRSVPNFWVV
jgi:hypothetical protein